MKEEKIYKPKKCEECPVCKRQKGLIVCGVSRNKKASINDYFEKKKMWETCEIGWDK